MSMRLLARQTRVLRPAAVSVRAMPRIAVAAPKRAGMRSFSSSVVRHEEFESPFGVNSLYKVSEEEEMLREAVRRFAENEVKPKVEEMDENEKMDPAIIKGLFEQGLMAIETDPELGGAGGSFMAAVIVIEGACNTNGRARQGRPLGVGAV